jgi:ribosomal protein L31E
MKKAARKPTIPLRNGKQPLFVRRAERAMQRVARKLRAEHRRLKLPLLVWKNGRAIKIRP